MYFKDSCRADHFVVTVDRLESFLLASFIVYDF